MSFLLGFMRYFHWKYCDTATSRESRAKHHFLVIKVGLEIALASVVFDVIVVREHDPGHAISLVIQSLEGRIHRAFAQAVLQLVDARQQHAQPGPSALAERDHDGIGQAQRAPVLAAARPGAGGRRCALLGYERQMQRAGAHQASSTGCGAAGRTRNNG